MSFLPPGDAPMKSLPLMLALLGCSGAALAQSAESLDLKLPASSLYGQDPPGTYYGDTSGRPAKAVTGETTIARNACGTPLEEDDGKTAVHGSVATGIGHTSGRGTSHWNAATVNLCKAYTTDEGKTGAFNLNIGVSQYDGPGLGPGYYYGPGPYRRAPGDVGPPPPMGAMPRMR